MSLNRSELWVDDARQDQCEERATEMESSWDCTPIDS